MKANTTVILLLFFYSGFSRQPLNIKPVIKQLQDKSDRQALLSAEADKEFEKGDSSSGFYSLTQLQESGNKDPHFQARLLVIEAQLIIRYRTWQPFNLQPIEALYDKAVRKAIAIKDEMLLAEVCRKYALFCDRFSLVEKAMFYSLKSLELQEKYGIEKFPDPLQFYLTNSNILYKVGEYELCSSQLNKVIRLLKTHNAGFPVYYAYNTLGLACFKLNKFDSAVYWYRTGLPVAIEKKDTAWRGILTGNIGDVYFKEKKYDSAKNYLLREYYITNNSTVENKSANNSLLMVARILALEGKTDSALRLIKKAAPNLIDYYYIDNRNLFTARAEVFQAMHNYDSASIYFSLYMQQDDSIKQRQMRSKMDVTLIKLGYDKSQQVIEQMLVDKKRERNRQFLLIAGIVLTFVIGFVIVRQRLQRNRLEKELLLQQKMAAEESVAAAREQLDLFTSHIIEKNEMIGKLEGQLDAQHESIHSELITQTILTEEDWIRFKSLFEKARPGFFEYLRNTSPGITPAELRLAALLQLKIDTKNMAAMQGVSAESMRKAKSRLRQRLNISKEDGLEEYIYAIPVKS